VPRNSRWLYRRLKELPTGKLFSVQPLFWEATRVSERRRFPAPVPCSIFVWLDARQRLSRSVIQTRCLIVGSCTALYRFNAANAIQALWQIHAAFRQAGWPAPDARCPRELEMPTGFLHGEIESRVPRAPPRCLAIWRWNCDAACITLPHIGPPLLDVHAHRRIVHMGSHLIDRHLITAISVSGKA
jgi:hypothetical protein